MKNTRVLLLQMLNDDRVLRALRVLWLLMAAVVAIAALAPQDRAPTMTPSDKIDHVLAFAALAVVAALITRRHRRSLVLAGAVHLLFGAAIEIGQMWVPGRDGSAADLVADAVGIAAGGLLAALLLRGLRG